MCFQKKSGGLKNENAMAHYDFGIFFSYERNCGMQPGTKQYVKLQAEETLYEWSGNKEVLNRLEDFHRENQTLNGKIYGIPWGSTGMMGVFYNKEVFEKAGVQPPKNYADLLNIAGKIKAAGLIPFYEGVKDAWPAQIFYFTGWVSHIDPVIGPEGVAKLDKNELKLSEIPKLKELFNRQLELKNKGYFRRIF
jgi:raffinose/stachyose/melibiose transport system substrate-binding protein